MPLYMYKAKNESGKILTGEAKIASEEDLVNLLVEKGYTPVEIKVKNAFTDISQISIFKPKVKTKDLAVFCRQFAIVLEAGVPIASALDVLREQTQNLTLKECISDVYENIQKGSSLTLAMKQHAKIFPDILLNMVESGEISGQLDGVFVRMADYFENQNKLNQKIRGAMTYPIIVVFVAIAVIIVLMAKVVPGFIDILNSFNVEMPVFTKILVAVSDVFKSFWWLMVIMIFALVAGIKAYYSTDSGKMFFGNLAIKAPVVKGLTKNIMTARLTRTLGTLMSSGVLLIQAMEIVQKIVGNAVISERLNFVTEEIKKGRGLTQPLASLKYFPPMLISMIKIGEESGNLDYSLGKCADFYDQEVEVSVQQLTALIEPAVIIFLSVVVGFIIISVLFPMFSIYQNMAV